MGAKKLKKKSAKNQDDELYPFAYATLEQMNEHATQLAKPIKISIKKQEVQLL